ncbi:fungal-specific transcription factor domain-containing protein [Xylogone sp. PMI_703]|nr:fungal-specific transcription factor domain-containing protein [Xylogone sp. PMI_703]
MIALSSIQDGSLPPQFFPITSLPRKYRSKRQRPCDLCRKRKTQCKILKVNSACELCIKLNRECTFIFQPQRRDRPACRDTSNSSQGASANSATATATNQGVSAVLSTPGPNLEIGDINFDIDALLRDFGNNQSPSLYSNFDIQLPKDTASGDNNRYFPQHASGRGYDSAPSSFSPPRAVHGSHEASDGSTSTSSPNHRQSSTLHMSSPVQLTGMHQDTESSNLGEYSLDRRAGYSSQLIGLSGESDPFLLRHFSYRASDNYPMFKLDYRKMVDDTNLQQYATDAEPLHIPRLPAGEFPVQFMMVNEDICEESTESPHSASSTCSDTQEEKDRASVERIVPFDLHSRLVKLYFEHIHPSSPILSIQDLSILTSGDLNNFSVGILAAIYALAIPFCFLDDALSVQKGYRRPPTEELWAIVERGLKRSSSVAHLELVQLHLLQILKPPQNPAVADPPDTWGLTCSALAAAQSLGLHLDPSTWRLPSDEIKLRKRLWWLVYMEHVWHATVLGRPSHIISDQWEVANLTENDFDTDMIPNRGSSDGIQVGVYYVIALSEISTIGDEALRQLYTVKAIRRTHTLADLLARAEPLIEQLQKWKDNLPLSLRWSTMETTDDESPRRGPLKLAYLTIRYLIFRALQRPLFYRSEILDEDNQETQSMIFAGSHTCAKAGIDLIASLKAKDFVTFWPSYTRYQISYITNFVLLIFVQSPTLDTAIKNKDLVEKWRNTVRFQARAWQVLKLAAMRLDAIYWKGLDKTVTWAGKGSPAEIVLRSSGSYDSTEP